VQPLQVATLSWRLLTFDFLNAEASRASLATALADLGPQADRTILRVTLSGTASPVALAEFRAWLTPTLAPFLVSQLIDGTRVALSPVELADLQVRHPILAQVLADIDRLETFAGGNVTVMAAAPSASDTPQPVAIVAPLTLAEAQTLLATAKIDLTQLTPEWFARLRQTLFQSLQEVTS
jgi:hypothetical protein